MIYLNVEFTDDTKVLLLKSEDINKILDRLAKCQGGNVYTWTISGTSINYNEEEYINMNETPGEQLNRTQME